MNRINTPLGGELTDFEILYGAMRVASMPEDLAVLMANRALDVKEPSPDDEALGKRFHEWFHRDKDAAVEKMIALIQKSGIKIVQISEGKSAAIIGTGGYKMSAEDIRHMLGRAEENDKPKPNEWN